MAKVNRQHLFAINLATCVALVLCGVLCGCANQAQDPQATSKASTPLPGSTLFLYMSGSDLETKQGQASVNLNELVQAGIPEGVRVIVQTGGSSKWHKFGIANDKLQRYEVRDGELVLLDELENSSMGTGWTLYQFLEWGKANYWAERNMLVLWGHGGTSGENVCYDHLYDSSIHRDDLDDALLLGLDEDRLDVLAFDACFMGSVENAALVSKYADWMLATTQVTPYTGLDYVRLASDLGSASTEELCKNACDAFVKKCQKDSKGARAQMSAFDLSHAGEVVDALDTYMQQASTTVLTEPTSAGAEGKAVGMLRNDGSAARLRGAAEAARIYGENGATSLVDASAFLGEASAMSGVDADAAIEALGRLVSYSALGSDCQSCGVALYHPLAYGGATLEKYIATCPIASYGSLLAAIDGQWSGQLTLDDSGGNAQDDGTFALTVGPDAARTIEGATYTLWRQDTSDPSAYVLVGQGMDLSVDWDAGSFASAFTGLWPHLWGQPLLTTAYLAKASGAQIYAPAIVNGEYTNVLATFDGAGIAASGTTAQDADQTRASVVLWDGLNKDGSPSHVYGKIAPGEEVAPYEAIGETDMFAQRGPSATVPVDVSEAEANHVELAALPNGTYRYQMTLHDIFGQDVTSDYALYQVSDGQAQLLEVQPAAQPVA